MKRLMEQDQVRPGFIVAGIAIVAALLGFLVVNFLFLGDDGSEDVAAPVTTTQPQASAAPQPAATPTPTPSETQVPLGQGRDPFQPVGGAPAPAEVQEPDVAQVSTDLEVLSVAEDNSIANVRVGDIVHERVGPGAQISGGYTIESIEGGCVNFVRGEGEGFQVCEGDTVQVAIG